MFYVVLQFYSPQPTSLTILHRSNATASWEAWQYYAEDCQDAFGLENNGDLDTPTSVNCIQFPRLVESQESKLQCNWVLGILFMASYTLFFVLGYQ